MGRILLYDGEELQEIDINLEWEEMVKAIGCDYMDIVTRKIGDRFFDIVCDDEFLLREQPSVDRITVMDPNMDTVLMGKVLFTTSNYGGETLPLSDDDVKTIEDALRHVFFETGETIKVIMVNPLR